MSGLSYEDTAKILGDLAELQDDLIPVGGQALNFWAERYMGRAQERHDDLAGRRVAVAYGVDPFSAVPLDETMPRAFREKGHPQMVARLAARRARDGEPATGYSSGLVVHPPSASRPR